MKKRIVLLALIMGFAISNIKAQLEMSSTGQISIATTPAPNAWTELGISFSSTTGSRGTGGNNYALSVGNTPTYQALVYYGISGTSVYSSTNYQGQTYGVFGEAGNATPGWNFGVFGQLAGSSSSNYGAGIFGAAIGYGGVYTGGNYAGYFNGNVEINGICYANSYPGNSDARLKKNVTPITNTTFNKISQLKAVQFQYKTKQELMAAGVIPNDTSKSDTANGNFINKVHFGFIAQDVQPIFPNLVYQKDNGLLGVNYPEFIPLIYKL